MAKQTDYNQCENEELVKIIRSGRDTDGAVILLLMSRCKPYSWNIYKRYRYSVETAELDSITYIAHRQACETFSSDRGYYMPYYGLYLQTELSNASGDNGSGFHVPRRVQDNVRRYRKAVQDFVTVHQRDPTTLEIMRMTGFTRDELEELTEAYNAMHPTSLDCPIVTEESDGDCTIGDLTADQTDTEQIITDKVYIEDLRKELRDIMTGSLTREQRNAVDVRSYGVADYAMLIGQSKEDVRRNYTSGLKILRRPEHARRLRGYLETDNLFTATGYSSFRRTGTSSPERITINRLDK